MSFLMFLCQTPAGVVVDMIGAKRVFVLGLACTAGAMILVGVSSSYYWMLVWMGLNGIGQAAFHPADYALIDSVTAEERKGRNFGYHTFAGFAGFAVAPLVVGGLGQLYSWEFALVVVGSAGLIFTSFVLVCMDGVHKSGHTNSSEDSEEKRSLIGRVRGFMYLPTLLLFGLFFVSTLSSQGIQTFTTIFFTDGFGYNNTLASTALTVHMSAAAGGVLIGGFATDRYDVYAVIAVALSTAAGGLLILATPIGSSTVVAAVLLYAVVGFAYGLALPSRDRIVESLSSSESIGTSFGFVYTGLSLGGFVSPVLLGGILDLSTVSPAILSISFFFILGVLFVGGVWRCQ